MNKYSGIAIKKIEFDNAGWIANIEFYDSSITEQVIEFLREFQKKGFNEKPKDTEGAAELSNSLQVLGTDTEHIKGIVQAELSRTGLNVTRAVSDKRVDTTITGKSVLDLDHEL